jgi:hypothetical protein
VRLDPDWFRGLVDGVPQPDLSGGYDRNEHVARISALHGATGDTFAGDVRALGSHFFLRAEVEGATTMTYATVAEWIGDCLENGRPLVECSDARWRSAVASAHLLATAEPLDEVSRRIRYGGLRELARQAKKMMAWGVPAHVQGVHVVLSPGDTEIFCQKLDADVKDYGGFDLARETLAAISHLYDATQARFHLCRRVPQLPTKPPRAMLPRGYLLNLCVKHSEPRSMSVGSMAPFRNSIEKRATALAACMNVEPYSIFEYMFSDARSLPRQLQKIALYDASFALFQLRPTDVPRVLRGVFDWVDEGEMKARLGYTVDEAAAVSEAILRLANAPVEPIVFSSRLLEAEVNLSTISAVLRDLTHQVPPNPDFLDPSEACEVNFWFRPLLKQDDAFVLVNASWCAPAFYEAIAGALRDAFGDIGSQIGLGAERFVRRELGSHGLNVSSGKYTCAGQDGECDAVIETDNEIVLLELKAKALTRRAREGSDVHLLLDLADSLLAAQVQLGQHELLLRRHGALELKQPDGSTYHLNLAGRDIERVSTTLLDFGGLHDRTILHNVMNVLSTTRYDAHDKAYRMKFGELKEASRRLLEQTQELVAFDGRLGGNPFFACWFLSIPQLLVMLDDVHDPQSFRQALRITRHVHMATLDFYVEYAEAKKLRRQRA